MRVSTTPLLADEKLDDKGDPVAIEKLPKAVVDGVKKALPGAKFEKPARRIKAGDKVTYFIPDVRTGKKEWDLTVSEDGAILKKVERHDDD